MVTFVWGDRRRFAPIAEDRRGRGGAREQPLEQLPIAVCIRTSVGPRWLLLGLVVLAAAVRVYWGSHLGSSGAMSRSICGWATDLLHGQGYQFFGISGVHFSPLYPLLAGLIARLIGGVAGDSPQALASGSVTLYILCGTLLVLPIYGIARRTGRPCGRPVRRGWQQRSIRS